MSSGAAQSVQVHLANTRCCSWEVFRYIADDPFAERPLPRNAGKEAMAYLTFMVEQYHDLPDYIVFLHGHERSWHQPEPIQYKIKALNLAMVDKYGFVPFRCTLFGHCEGPQRYAHPHSHSGHPYIVILKGIYNYTYRLGDPWYEPLPEEFAAACCAQFAVSKKQALTRPLEYWQRIRAPLLRDMWTEFPEWHVENENSAHQFSYRVGASYEILWHWMFGMRPITCYDEDFCHQTFFQDRIHCDGKTGKLVESIDLVQNITCTYTERLK